jgi:hypothetical protein
MVYKARREVLQRLRELAGHYADEGCLTAQVREALESLPDGRSLSGRITKTIDQNRKG